MCTLASHTKKGNPSRPPYRNRGIAVYVSGIQAGHHQALDALAVLDELRTDGRVFSTTPEAITAARSHLHQTGVLPTPRAPNASPP